MFDIITFGSATIDIFAFLKPLEKKGLVCFKEGGKEILQGLEVQTGGGGTNTAVSFANLGLKTAFCGQVGNDLFADFIKKDLLKRRIDLSLVKIAFYLLESWNYRLFFIIQWNNYRIN